MQGTASSRWIETLNTPSVSQFGKFFDRQETAKTCLLDLPSVLVSAAQLKIHTHVYTLFVKRWPGGILPKNPKSEVKLVKLVKSYQAPAGASK